MSRIYVASSWRNDQQPAVVAALREAGHEVYDFKNPAPGNVGFGWDQCAEHGDAKAGPRQFARVVTRSPIAQAGFALDKAALDWCDVCVLVLPCGRSAHLEAGYAIGQGKRVFFLLSEDKFEPELMYLLGDGIALHLDDILDALIGAYAKCRMLDRHDPECSHCEHCGLSIAEGDKSQRFRDGPEYCEACAETWGEALASAREQLEMATSFSPEEREESAAWLASIERRLASGEIRAEDKAVS